MPGKEKLKLQSVHIKGFKSIDKEGQEINFGDISVFLGANGSGKSNLVSFFRMLNYMMTGSLQTYIGESGSGNSLLHYGSKQTSRMEAVITFGNSTEKDLYKFVLSHAAGDTLIFNEETLTWQKQGNPRPYTITMDPGLKESGFIEKSKSHLSNTLKVIYALLINCKAFQFHDTSFSSRIRNSAYVHDNKFLRSDGGNLPAFLYMLKNTQKKYYNRIIGHIRQIMPQFGDFVLEPLALNNNSILLDWQENKSDYLFGPHQISDGSLRFMCLATLLLQPPKTLPSVIILDEPELGLHPSAISMLAGMVRTASKHCQIAIATQSPRLVDEFDPENIVIVERNHIKNTSEFKKLDEAALNDWLENYSLSELWEKNVLGGQP